MGCRGGTKQGKRIGLRAKALSGAAHSREGIKRPYREPSLHIADLGDAKVGKKAKGSGPGLEYEGLGCSTMMLADANPMSMPPTTAECCQAGR